MIIYSDTGISEMREKERRVKGRTYTREIRGNIRGYLDRQRQHRQKCGSRDETIHGQSVTIQPRTDRGSQREDRKKHGE